MNSTRRNDDITTVVWVDPQSGEDHAITVMRCGKEWWSYVDTTRISEDCRSKSEAIEVAQASLVERYKSRTEDAAAEPSSARKPEERSGLPGARTLAILGVGILSCSAIAATFLFNHDVARDFLGSFSVAGQQPDGPDTRTGLPPLPDRKIQRAAGVKTGWIKRRIETVAVSDFKPTAANITRRSLINRDPPVREVQTSSNSSNSRQSAYRPAPRLEVQDVPLSKVQSATRQQEIAAVEEADKSARHSVRAISTTIRNSGESTRKNLQRPIARTRQRKTNKPTNNTKRHKSHRIKSRKARRHYRHRQLVSVRRVRVGKRSVKIVRFRRPRNLSEYRRLQSARNRIIANYLRKRRSRHGY